MGIRTSWWIVAAHFGGDMLATIVMLMKWKCTHSNQSVSASIVLLMKLKYALSLSESRKWQEHVRYDCIAYEMELRTGTAWGSK